MNKRIHVCITSKFYTKKHYKWRAKITGKLINIYAYTLLPLKEELLYWQTQLEELIAQLYTHFELESKTDK